MGVALCAFDLGEPAALLEMWRSRCVPATFTAYVPLEVALLPVRAAEGFRPVVGQQSKASSEYSVSNSSADVLYEECVG